MENNISLEQAFSTVVQIANAHLCNAADRDLINKCLKKISDNLFQDMLANPK